MGTAARVNVPLLEGMRFGLRTTDVSPARPAPSTREIDPSAMWEERAKKKAHVLAVEHARRSQPECPQASGNDPQRDLNLSGVEHLGNVWIALRSGQAQA
jgi:hypothetical protein